METLRAQLLKIQQQLSGLTVSQKMLTASLVAIMVMTIVWWARYAGTAEMEPVLDQSLSASDMGQIKAALDLGRHPSTGLSAIASWCPPTASSKPSPARLRRRAAHQHFRRLG